jgi:hypothetical protein
MRVAALHTNRVARDVEISGLSVKAGGQDVESIERVTIVPLPVLVQEGAGELPERAVAELPLHLVVDVTPEIPV